MVEKLNIFRELLKELTPGEIKIVANEAKDADIAAQYQAILNSKAYNEGDPMQQTEYRIAFGLRQSLNVDLK